MKVCYICKIEKEKSEFCPCKKLKDGLNSYCRKCFNLYQNKNRIGKRIHSSLIINEIEPLEGEEWKDVVGYEEHYSISTHGRVWRKDYYNGTIGGYKKYGKRSNYYSVGLSNNHKKSWHLVHRLVAKAFIPNKENKSIVNHIDGNTINNHISNLEWTDNRENQSHGFSTKNVSSKYTGVCWNKQRSIWTSQLRMNKKSYYLGSFLNEEDAGLAYKEALIKYGLTNKYAF